MEMAHCMDSQVGCVTNETSQTFSYKSEHIESIPKKKKKTGAH